jgi:hypothetical protein
MTITYVLVLYLIALALSYQLRFTEATLHMGRTLSGTSSGTGFQDAITPPASAYFAFGVYGLAVLVIVFGFFWCGLLMGLAAFLGFLALVSLNRIFLLPKPESSHFREIVIKSMIRRHADYLRNGNQLRAVAMADLLKRAGIPVSEFAHRVKGEGGA